MFDHKPSYLSACRLRVLIFLALFLSGCASPPEQVKTPELKPPAGGKITAPKDQIAVGGQEAGDESDWSAESESSLACGECVSVDQAEQRDSCFNLRPGRKVPCTRIVKGKNGKKKKVAGTRSTRCQPQSLIYARCRTGIDTCRLGDTSPVQWFACARKNGTTTAIPKAGSVMILAGNNQRRMPTGHPAYVEEVCANKDGTWTLRLSHTNYDRKCNLDLDAKVIFCPKTQQARFVTGPWSCWAKNLKVLGFILG